MSVRGSRSIVSTETYVRVDMYIYRKLMIVRLHHRCREKKCSLDSLRQLIVTLVMISILMNKE